MSNEKIKTEIYKDLLQPSIREIGKTLHSVTKTARFVFAGIDYLAAKQDRWQNFLKNVSSRVEEENLIEAHPQIVGPIIEGMIYTDDETLIGEMFAELLAKAVDKNQQDKAHPAFPKIIQQLSHDEAVILFFLKKQSFKVHQQWDFNNHKILNTRTILEELPINKLVFPNNIWMYMDHLNSLTIAGTWKYTQDEPLLDNGIQTGGITKSERKLSDFGILFASACIPDNYGELSLT